MARLPGDPGLPFALRFNLLASEFFPAISLVSMAVIAAAWVRASSLGPAGSVWLGSLAALHVTTLLLRKHAPGFHARWRCLPAAVFRLYGLGWGAAYDLARGMLCSLPPPAQGGLVAAARHLALLATFSHSLGMLLYACAPLRLGWAAATQLVGAAHAIAHNNGMICALPVLEGRYAAALTHGAFEALNLLPVSLALPAASAAAAALTPQAECRALMAFLQLSIGTLVPLVVQAAVESRLWQLHQSQRAAASLPPEPGGWHGSAYAAVLGLAEALDPLTAALAAYMALGIAWLLAVAAATAHDPQA